MTTYMHRRRRFGINLSTCSYSFCLVQSDFTKTSNYQALTSSLNHDQTPSPPPVIPKRRRRLEDPITTYASNYYATLPLQMSQSPSLPSPRRIGKKTNRNGTYCDLFNLLENPSPTPPPLPPPPPVVTQKRRNNTDKDSSRRLYRSKDFGHVYTKKTTNRKRSHQQASYFKENEHQIDTLLPIERYGRSKEKTKVNDIHQRCSTNKGFFRRIIRNYFCLPSKITTNEYSS